MSACARRFKWAWTPANVKLACVEQIKRFAIIEDDWLPGRDELTPTMKLPAGRSARSTLPR
jgi:hypothetical protein